MSEVTYISGWKSELCIKLNTGNNNKADFNRFLVKGSISTKALQQGGVFESADREGVVLQLKKRFSDKLEEGSSPSTLYSHFKAIHQYFSWCDKENMPVYKQPSLEGYMHHLDNKVMRGEIKSSTYLQIHSCLTIVFTCYLDFPTSFFDNVVVRGTIDSEPFEAYTRSDLNQLLPFLRQVFKQTYKQFILDPDKHLNASHNSITMTFHWQCKEYHLFAGLSKMMCAGTFLLAYYTFANTGELFKLKHPVNASMTLGDAWFTMPAFKRRAFKTVQVEMGGHDLEIPKYALDFFFKLLTASKIINPSDDATLLQTISLKKSRPISSSMLQSFIKLWVEKNFTFTDQTGRRLRPVVSRFRETGSHLMAYHQGDLANNIMLNNTPRTRERHYSTGSKIANNGMLQDAMEIREEQVRNKVGTKQARRNLNIKVLVIEAEHKVNIPKLSRTINGGSCGDPFGEKSDKYTKQAQSRGLVREGERLACADLLACFGCPHQIIVQSVADIWCLLSFKACLEESLYLHLDAGHYRNNFEEVTQFIQQKILPNINRKILKEAEEKLNHDGHHPLWNDSENVMISIPVKSREAK